VFHKTDAMMMDTSPKMPAYLLLEDGTLYIGKASGKIGTTTGELCFNTGMTGYQEVFTDPSYYRQILIMTNNHIGNYGISATEIESDGIKIAGLVTKKMNQKYSRKMAVSNIETYFEDNGVVGITDVDTRAIVRHIRDKGAMNAIISSEISELDALKKKLSEVPSMKGLELSSEISVKEAYFVGDEKSPIKVAVLDLGVKKNILRCFAERDVYLKVFPAKTTFAEMNAWQPNGYFISNGPGDPSAMPYAVSTVKEILASNIPLFGICLGHQILAEANGISTYKMHNGHRGLNHPVKNVIKGSSEITSQNHGFAVHAEEVRKNSNLEVTHVNLNDETIEGIRVKDKLAFSVQYHPESSPGPHDSRYLFDDFITMIKASL
jgi:carbamoyl-phosphate synthase small subunit